MNIDQMIIQAQLATKLTAELNAKSDQCMRYLIGVSLITSSKEAKPRRERPERKRRQRKPDIAAMIRGARKAGEKGAVRVSVADPNGFTVTVSTGGDQNEQANGDAVANPWDEVSKRATH
jgi:hypothetical protein